MAKKKVRKAGMVKRQQTKKHTKEQQRRKFASRRTISNPQAATQKRLEELLSTLPYLAFSERFENLQFDVQTVKEELEATTPEPLLLMKLLTVEFLEGFRSQFEEFERETTPQSPDNLLAKATIHQLDHSNEIPHLSNPMIVAVYLKTRAEALGEEALTKETIHDALNNYEVRNSELIELISENPGELIYGPGAIIPNSTTAEIEDKVSTDSKSEEVVRAPPISEEVLADFRKSLDWSEGELTRLDEDLELFLDDFQPPVYQEWTPVLIDEFISEWFVREANPLEEDLASMRKNILYLLRYLREKSLLPSCFGDTRPASLEGAA
jgi:hypothetical protein